jgi:alpha-D-ribose 1-methylphosphonate 5-triphosphate synthase subunit PhnG
MVKLREQARNSVFYLGEVLVTEAKARINGHPGLGLVRGNNRKLAGDLAVIDAAWRAGLEETAEWEGLLLAAEEENLQRQREENGRILETKVDFASMQEEDYV